MGPPIQPDGPTGHHNWRASIEGSQPQGAQEFGLYSDAQITGELREGIGPYKVFNLVPRSGPRADCSMCAVLRWDNFLGPIAMSSDATDTTRYHGGDQTDEIASLIGLVLGVRLRSGGRTRVFEEDDPRGRPAMWGHVTPALRRPIEGPFILPDAVRTAELDATCRDRLATYPLLAPEEAVKLVRAAHLYAIALWDGEDDPPGAWLSLVGAIEAAGGTTTSPPEDLLRQAKPDLVAKLDAGGPGLVEAVAAAFGAHLQATKKFLDFLLLYMPGPPPKRPPEGFQLPWSRTKLRKGLDKVYDLRSTALHGGQPFPPPMCCVPDIVDDQRIPAEIPTGVATMTPTGTWRTEDTPMMLHTFAYIVRGALLAWWEDMVSKEGQA